MMGVDLRIRVERLGAKEKARREKCNVRFSIIKKNKAFQKNYMKVGVQKLLRAVMMPALYMEAYVIEVEEKFSTMASQRWAEGVGQENGVTS